MNNPRGMSFNHGGSHQLPLIHRGERLPIAMLALAEKISLRIHIFSEFYKVWN